jgi:hypothetical protein
MNCTFCNKIECSQRSEKKHNYQENIDDRLISKKDLKIGDGMCILSFLNKLKKELGDYDSIKDFFDRYLHIFRDIGKHTKNRLFSLKYLDHSKLWTPWSRKARGTIFSLKDDGKYYIVKELLDRGAEVLTGSQGVEETETFNPKAATIYTKEINETIRLLKSKENFHGHLSMKVDGSLCSINLYPVNGYVHKMLKEFIHGEIQYHTTRISQGDVDSKKNILTFLIAERILEISEKELTDYVMGISSHNTLFGDSSFMYWTISSILSGFMNLNWNMLSNEVNMYKTEHDDFHTLMYLIDKYLPTFCSYIKTFKHNLNKAIPKTNNENMCLSFEAVCPNRLDLFKNDQANLLAVSYNKAYFRFLGINYGFKDVLGTYLPHSDATIQTVLGNTRKAEGNMCFDDPLYWDITNLNSDTIDRMLIDLEEVLVNRITVSDYLNKYRPSNKRNTKNEILDYEGFILYRLIDLGNGNKLYDYNKVKHRLYYKFHKIRVEHLSELSMLPNSVCLAYPQLIKVKAFNTIVKSDDFKTRLDKTILDYFNKILTNSTDELVLIFDSIENKSTKQLKMESVILNRLKIGDMKVASINFSQYLYENSSTITDKRIYNNLLKVIDEFLILFKLSINYDLKISKKGEEINVKKYILNILITYYKALFVASKHESDDKFKELYDFLWEHGEGIKNKIPIKTMTWNILSNVLYTSEKRMQNIHGFSDQVDIIDNKVREERLSKVRDFIIQYEPDILLLQEVNRFTDNILQIPTFPRAFGNLITDYNEYGRNCSYNFQAKDEKSRIKLKYHGTCIFYNKNNFNLLASKGGCFLSGTRQTDSGSGYSCMLLQDNRTLKRVFILNIHVSILDWNDDNSTIEHISDEIDNYVFNFVLENDINPKDIILLGGDLNAGKEIIDRKGPFNQIDYYGESFGDYNTYKDDEVFFRNYDKFYTKLLQSKFIQLVGNLKETEDTFATQIDCKSGKSYHVDHILTNINQSNNPNYNNELLNDFKYLRTSCNLDKFDDDQLKNINYNRRLRASGIDLSDHRPNICELYYNDYLIEPLDPVETNSKQLNNSIQMNNSNMTTKKRGTIFIIYSLGWPGVGKTTITNYMLEELKSQTKVVFLKRDAFPVKDNYAKEIIKQLQKHDSGDMVLFLDRNFDPSSFKFNNGYLDIKEFTLPKDGKNSINSTIAFKMNDYNIKNIVLNFNTSGINSKVNIVDKYISFVNTLKRTDHENIKDLYTSFITMVAFSRNWSSNIDINSIPSNYTIFDIQWHTGNFVEDLLDKVTILFLKEKFIPQEIEKMGKSFKQYEEMQNGNFKKDRDIVEFISKKLNVSIEEVNKMIQSFTKFNSHALLDTPASATLEVLSFLKSELKPNIIQEAQGGFYRKYLKYKELYLRLKYN